VGGASGAILSELLGGIAGEPVQVELSEVRILFELLGFLLKRKLRRHSVDLRAAARKSSMLSNTVVQTG
jgi:hypothetical protein